MCDFLLNVVISRDVSGCLFLRRWRVVKIGILAGALVCGKVKLVKELGNVCCDSLVTLITNLNLRGGIDLDLEVIDAGL